MADELQAVKDSLLECLRVIDRVESRNRKPDSNAKVVVIAMNHHAYRNWLRGKDDNRYRYVDTPHGLYGLSGNTEIVKLEGWSTHKSDLFLDALWALERKCDICRRVKAE